MQSTRSTATGVTHIAFGDLIQIQITPGEVVQRDGFYFMDLRLSERRFIEARLIGSRNEV